MANSKIVNFNDFDIAKLVYGKPSVSNGRISIPLNYSYPDGAIGPLYLSTPRMAMPFGISVYQDNTDGVDSSKKTIQLAMSNVFFREQPHPEKDGETIEVITGTDPVAVKFFTSLRNIDNAVVDYIFNNPDKVSQKKLSYDVVKSRYSPIVKEPKNKDSYGPMIRASPFEYEFKRTLFWMLKDDESGAKVKQEITLDQFENPVNAQVACALDLSRIWFAAKGFGVKANLKECFIIEQGVSGEKTETSILDISSIPNLPDDFDLSSCKSAPLKRLYTEGEEEGGERTNAHFVSANDAKRAKAATATPAT